MDTARKRHSAMLTMLPFRGVSYPTGTVDQAARQIACYRYAGILAGATPTASDELRMSNIYLYPRRVS